MFRTNCFALALCCAGTAAAQTAAPPVAEPKAAAPLPAYDSAFKDYRPYVDPEIARWRDVNQEVGRLNGHIGHVPAQPGAVAKPAVKPPAQGGHGGHK